MESMLEHILAHSYKDEMISYLKSNPDDFDEAIKLAIDDKQNNSWRTAWLLWSCMDYNDHRIQKYVAQIITVLPASRDNKARELLIILQKMNLDNDLQGKLFDICVNIWKQVGKQPSVRYNAFKLMVAIAGKHPELYPELDLLTESQYAESLSGTVKKSVAKLLFELKH